MTKPQPLDYQPPRLPLPPVRLAWTKFFLAVFLGTAVSAAVWLGSGEGMWRNKGIGQYSFFFFCGVAGVKLALGYALLFFRNVRPVGIGLLLSLPLGGLLFFIGCASSIHI